MCIHTAASFSFPIHDSLTLCILSSCSFSFSASFFYTCVYVVFSSIGRGGRNDATGCSFIKGNRKEKKNPDKTKMEKVRNEKSKRQMITSIRVQVHMPACDVHGGFSWQVYYRTVYSTLPYYIRRRELRIDLVLLTLLHRTHF